jgi:hypothetical protein
MSALSHAHILPMKTAGTHHFIERTYREGSQYQWVREILVNAFEAGATRVEFGIEWQAVQNQGIFRRMIADNGCGMTADQLVEFFNTFGGGGKPIGGAHENFGVGSKTSLLPWNHYGMVVISWVDGDTSMIWVARDAKTGEYGLKTMVCEDAMGELVQEEVFDPYEDSDHGCDWAAVKPDWIEDHGTVIILLGNSSTTDTVQGDPDRSEADIKGISSFLNRRMWEIPEGVEVFVDELRTTDRDLWPSSEAVAHGPIAKDGRDRRTNMRRIEGARYYITYPEPRPNIGSLGAQGTVELRDGTEIDWFLWGGERPKVQSYAAIGGYIGTLYNRELYDVTTHHSTYRSFGVSLRSVRTNLWLIIRPFVDPHGRRGVYPKTDRNSLLIKGGPSAGGPLPINDWAAEFADNMPAEIVRALKEARQGSSGTLSDEEWRERLAEKFGKRWRIARLRAQKGGSTLLDPSKNGQPLPKAKNRTPVPPGPPGPNNRVNPLRPRPPQPSDELLYGEQGNSVPGAELPTPGGLPSYRVVSSGDIEEGMMAAWQRNDPEFPGGVVLLNIEHPVLRSVIEHWQLQYADHHAESIENDVIDIYGQVAVSKVAHSEHLKGILPSHIVEESLRSDGALTMALLGLMAEDHVIATRIGGKYNRRRLPVVDRRRASRPNGTANAG